MGKLIPFKQKQSSEEKSLRKRLQINPDDLETLGKILVLKIQQGKFDPKSDYAEGILRCIEINDVEEINKFLYAIAPIVEEMDWEEPSSPVPNLTSQPRTNIYDALINYSRESHLRRRFRDEIYKTYFKSESFIEEVHQLVQLPKSIEAAYSILGETDPHFLQLKTFFILCFNKIISQHGLIEELAYIETLSVGCLPLEKITDAEINNILNKYALKLSRRDKIGTVLAKITEKYLTRKLKQRQAGFTELYKLLELRYDLDKDYSDVCNAILDIIPETTIYAVTKFFNLDNGSAFQEQLINGWIRLDYIPKHSDNSSDFMEDLCIKLHETGNFNQDIAFNAYLVFTHHLENCPLNYLLLGSIYDMDEIADYFSGIKGFFTAGVVFSKQGLYQKSMNCFKTSLYNTAFFHEEKENPIEFIDMVSFIQVTKKLNSYEDSINFLSKFKLLHEHGLPIHQGFLNEIEAAKTELEYEHNARTYHKIDEFYELVAKEDFPAVQSHVTESKGQSKFVLTRDQLQVLISKIQEKSDIIKGIKSISAKCDMLMYMHREVYDKQAAIFEVMKENHGSIENLINQNTEKIIENIHKRNETLVSQINIKTSQDYYHDMLGGRLWKRLDEGTRTFLMLARHLDTTNQYSPSECSL